MQAGRRPPPPGFGNANLADSHLADTPLADKPLADSPVADNPLADSSWAMPKGTWSLTEDELAEIKKRIQNENLVKPAIRRRQRDGFILVGHQLERMLAEHLSCPRELRELNHQLVTNQLQQLVRQVLQHLPVDVGIRTSPLITTTRYNY